MILHDEPGVPVLDGGLLGMSTQRPEFAGLDASEHPVGIDTAQISWIEKSPWARSA